MDQYLIFLYRFFLEENMLQDIISIIKQNRSNKIKIQIIQTISILIQNIKNRTSLCRIFFLQSGKQFYQRKNPPVQRQPARLSVW